MVPEASRPESERRAIELVLEAEKKSEAAVSAAHQEAAQILAAARERCRRIHALADQRIARIHSGCSARTDQSISALKHEHAEREAAQLAATGDAQRIERAVDHVADWLLGDARPRDIAREGAA